MEGERRSDAYGDWEKVYGGVVCAVVGCEWCVLWWGVSGVCCGGV